VTYVSRNRIPESEVWFDRYLREHGYDPGDPEPDLGVSKKPDRLIERGGQRVVCEIKQFERGVFAGRSGSIGSLLPRDVLKPIRSAVKEAADQLRPLQGSGDPLVVVLANPKKVDVPLEVSDVIHALYGDPTYRFTIDTATGRAVGDVEFFAGRNGRLRNFHRYISAVVVLRHRTNAQDWVDERSAELLEGSAEPRTLDEATELATEFLESSLEAETSPTATTSTSTPSRRSALTLCVSPMSSSMDRATAGTRSMPPEKSSTRRADEGRALPFEGRLMARTDYRFTALGLACRNRSVPGLESKQVDKEHIVSEIRRTATANGGQALGKGRFAAETGIREADWRGRYWARWSDALAEAGFGPNEYQTATPEAVLMASLADEIVRMGRMPTVSELALRRRSDATFPSSGVFERLGPKSDWAHLVAEFFPDRAELQAILSPLLVDPTPRLKPEDGLVVSEQQDGFVYLLRSGKHYKIGYTLDVGRRRYDLAIQLPEAVEEVHTIRTDDPAGIERYWHERFADRRKNGEWFELTRADINAFKRRKFM
jgi:hypothetical protein